MAYFLLSRVIPIAVSVALAALPKISATVNRKIFSKDRIFFARTVNFRSRAV